MRAVIGGGETRSSGRGIVERDVGNDEAKNFFSDSTMNLEAYSYSQCTNCWFLEASRALNCNKDW